MFITRVQATGRYGSRTKQHSTMSTPVYLNGRSLSCLVCPESGDSCVDQKHPLQRVMTYGELTGKYARKINRDQHDGIDIYTCPHCGLDRLTIDALYEHSRAAHVQRSEGEPTDQNAPEEVHCPVCVCFRLEECTATVQQHAGGLVQHMLSRHCFGSPHQYDIELKLRTDFCCEDEFELIRFLAIFLPPAIITSQAAHEDEELSRTAHISKMQQHESPECTICLEVIDKGECKDLPLCHHQFHGPCINRWLVERNCCPICRSDCTAS